MSLLAVPRRLCKISQIYSLEFSVVQEKFTDNQQESYGNLEPSRSHEDRMRDLCLGKLCEDDRFLHPRESVVLEGQKSNDNLLSV